MVPLTAVTAVTLAALSIFPVFDQLADAVKDFAFRSLVPAAGETIERYVSEFADQASRLSLAGVWVDCALPLERGQVFLLYLAGERLLHAVPAGSLSFEFDLLGDPAWFYDAGGRLVDMTAE